MKTDQSFISIRGRVNRYILWGERFPDSTKLENLYECLSCRERSMGHKIIFDKKASFMFSAVCPNCKSNRGFKRIYH